MTPPQPDRLVLGTAQLGSPYGVANRSGQPGLESAVAIIRACLDSGVCCFDTAQAYGNSEEMLGRAIRILDAAGQVRIISKLSPVLAGTAEEIPASAARSTKLLGVEALWALMLHREEHIALLDGPLGRGVNQALGEGLCRYFGVSVYSPKAALEAITHPLVSVIQIPASLFDRRFEEAGVFARACDEGKTLHIRSALLQGALCMDVGELPPFLSRLAPALSSFAAFCEKNAFPRPQAAIAWLLHRYPRACVLFGAEKATQVTENIDAVKLARAIPETLFHELDAIFPPQDEMLLNPSRWK